LPVGGFYRVLIKMHRILYISICSIVLWLFAGCTETDEWDVDSVGWNYYPVEVGASHVYQVKGVRYINYLDSTSFEYLLKETVVDSFQNLENGISYTLLREKKYDSDDWVTDSVWSIRKDALRVILVENNVPIIQLSFPVEENKVWNSNALNDHDTDEFEMVALSAPFSVSGVDFSKTLTVIQEELTEDTYVKYISQKEVYAEDKGIVYKENVVLEYEQDKFYGDQVVESGIKYYQYLVE